jgi:Zn-dependent protease
MDNFLFAIAINAIPFLLAITMHEAAHGYAARALGDDTPQASGRLSLNPFNHFEWLGTAVLPVISVVILTATNGFGVILGWAKPTPFNPWNFANPRRDSALVVFAGVLANIVMAVAWAICFRLVEASSLRLIAYAGMLWNVGLVVLHLIPLPPLAAGMAVAAVLPEHLAQRYMVITRYAFFILIALSLSGLLKAFALPAYALGMSVLAEIAGR